MTAGPHTQALRRPCPGSELPLHPSATSGRLNIEVAEQALCGPGRIQQHLQQHQTPA